MNNEFWSSSLSQLYKSLESGPDGISSETAAKRLALQNKDKKVKSRIQRDLGLLFNQFKSPLVLLLVGAVILSIFLGEVSDVVIIIFILVATGILSFIQERNAGNAVEKLQSMLKIKTRVIRSGKSLLVITDQVVPGDILELSAGDIVPADAYIIEANQVYSNEASLTGESYPVLKTTGTIDKNASLSKRFNSLWQGSSIVSGTAKALVVNTGKDTIFGSISKSITNITETAFEKGIRQFGFFLMQITVVFSISILVFNLVFHKPLMQSLLFALALAVGMAPELLPAIMTIAMSAGARRMLKKKVIVKTLSSIQNLGEINLLCTDKTGTITEGIIKIVGMKDAEGNESDFIKKLAFINASFESGFSNPIDDAIKNLQCSTEGYEKIGEIPYDFLRKSLSIGVVNNKKARLITKGAVDNILGVCDKILINNTTKKISTELKNIKDKFIEFSNQGYRVIAISYKDLDNNTIDRSDETAMTFAGFVVMEDPLKEGIADTIATLDKMSVKIKIITGDNQYVAAHVGQKLGMKTDNIICGPDLIKMSPTALKRNISNADIFAEIEPNQKEIIIRALQKAGNVVAYMGDGINDVAALSAADAGISISNAVDVAREAADFVLLEKDLTVLAAGVIEGRRTFANTLKYIYINTGATFGNMFSVAIASLVLPFLPMLPTQILLTNFLTDFPYMAVSSDNVDEEQLKRPGKWNLKQIRSFMFVFGIHSSFFDLMTFYVLYKLLDVQASIFQTAWFLESILTELFILFIIRTYKPFLKSIPGKHLIWLSVLSLILTVVSIYAPYGTLIDLVRLPIKVIGSLMAIIIVYVITADVLKQYFFRRMGDSV